MGKLVGDGNSSEGIELLSKRSTPCVLKNGAKNWKPLAWKLEDWEDKLKQCLGDRLTVRAGHVMRDSLTPQWERNTPCQEINTSDMFDSRFHNKLKQHGKWVYFDYKYMAEMFGEEVLSEFDWGEFGVVGRTGKDSTLWIGTQGAHTPCHQDSYGYNVVVQLQGSKTWTLLPPDCGHNLEQTRIPYEESSVYSNMNFQNPDSLKQIAAKARLYCVTLFPGDVLYVPRHWWHSVYNKGLGISVNTWVPCREDAESKLEEAVVRMHAISFSRNMNRDDRDILLNPNEDDCATDCDIEQLAGLTEKLARLLASRLDSDQEECLDILTELNLVPETKYLNLDHFQPLDESEQSNQHENNHSQVSAKKLKFEPSPRFSNPMLEMFKAVTSKDAVEATCRHLVQSYRKCIAI